MTKGDYLGLIQELENLADCLASGARLRHINSTDRYIVGRMNDIVNAVCAYNNKYHYGESYHMATLGEDNGGRITEKTSTKDIIKWELDTADEKSVAVGEGD